jgi:broad-specificity NMP kinase
LTLIVVSGAPGTGKSIARALGADLRFPVTAHREGAPGSAAHLAGRLARVGG